MRTLAKFCARVALRLAARLAALATPKVLPEAAVPPPEPKAARKRLWERLASALAAPAPETERRPYQLPSVLPGVRPSRLLVEGDGHGGTVILAMDSGYKEPLATDSVMLQAMWGFTGNGALGPGLAFLGFPYLAELTQITEYRTPAETLSTEMTRTWMKLKNKDKKRDLKKKLGEIEERLTKLGVRDLFRRAALKTELFGRAHIYISIEGQDDDLNRQLPLRIENIKKGSLIGFSVIEPYWLTPYSWNATHPERPDFYKPQSWFVMGRKTHSSRLMTFIFREVPDLLKPAYDFAGISITQLMMPYVQRWLRTAKSVNDLINIFSIVTLSTDMQAYLEDPVEFNKRLQAFTSTRDNKGIMAIGKDTEELTVNETSLGSLDKLQAQSQEHMATPGRLPLIKFFGVTPTGLNATAEPEMLCFYDYTSGMQTLGFDPHIVTVVQVVQMDLYGEVDPDITHEWLALYTPTPKEKGEIRKADADWKGVLIDKGVVDNNEVRDTLKMDPDSGFDNLEGDAPEPPDVMEEGAESSFPEQK